MTMYESALQYILSEGILVNRLTSQQSLLSDSYIMLFTVLNNLL